MSDNDHNRILPKWLGYCEKHDRVYPVDNATDHIVKSMCSQCDNDAVIKEMCG